MHVYHDSLYVKELFEDYPIEECLSVYNRAVEQIHEDRLWDLFILEVEHGKFQGNFEKYKKMNQDMSKNKKMKDSEKEIIRNNTEELRRKMSQTKGTIISISGLK
jgi:hypothetical protein